nr:hypothetical protein [Tanacetum cinerariifolium]
MLKNVSPLTKWTHIEPNVWDQFCQNENTVAKNKLRAQARARGQKQITRPRVGPKGYRGFEKQWEKERNDPDKATKLHLIPDLRSSNYCLARAPRDKVGIKPLPADLIDVSKKLAQAASELSQSSNESKSGVDPLIMVKKRTSEQRKDNEEIRNEVRQQMKEELKSSDFWLEMRAEPKVELRNEILAEHNLSPRKDDVPSSVKLKSSLNLTTNMVRNESQGQQNESFSPRQDHRRLNLSSTKSIVKEEQQGEQNESSSTKPVDVSTSVFKIQCIKRWYDTFSKTKKGAHKVAVLKVMEEHKNMELPVRDDKLPYLESTVNGFIQWLIFAIGRYKVL